MRGAMLCLCGLLLFAAAAFGEERKDAGSPERLSSFADNLFREKDYYRAITEYKRLIFLYPEHPLSKAAALKIPLSYLEGKQFETARRGFERFMKDHPGDPLAWEALLLMAEADFGSGDYESALELFSRAEAEAVSPDASKRAALRKGDALLRMGKWREAADVFAPLEEDPALEGLADYAQKGEEIPHKSPKLAGTLSAILPGSGQLYIGRKKDAVVAFLLNAAFIVGAHEAFKKDEHAVGGILLFFEAGWYAGNIYSAASGAHKLNRTEKDRYIRRVEGKFSLGMTPSGEVRGLYHVSY